MVIDLSIVLSSEQEVAACSGRVAPADVGGVRGVVGGIGKAPKNGGGRRASSFAMREGIRNSMMRLKALAPFRRRVGGSKSRKSRQRLGLMDKAQHNRGGGGGGNSDSNDTFELSCPPSSEEECDFLADDEEYLADDEDEDQDQDEGLEPEPEPSAPPLPDSPGEEKPERDPSFYSFKESNEDEDEDQEEAPPLGGVATSLPPLDDEEEAEARRASSLKGSPLLLSRRFPQEEAQRQGEEVKLSSNEEAPRPRTRTQPRQEEGRQQQGDEASSAPDPTRPSSSAEEPRHAAAAPCLCQRRRQRHVAFGTVQIRRHEIILGDNPDVSSGPPISLGWKHSPVVQVCTVDRYEAGRESAGRRRRTREELALPVYVRRVMVRRAGYSEFDIVKAVSDVKKAQKRRARTNQLFRLESFACSAVSTLGGGKALPLPSSGAQQQGDRKQARPLIGRRQTMFV